MPTTQHYIIATAGHVDHGKSSLVKALTGTDPDRLPEEKARGITIDLGFAHLELSAPARPPAPAATCSLGIVDVPGHEDFVKNMVAGVGSIDLALFVVAADDGWMPQTEEHLQILSYLGVRHAVVALTKIDLAPEDEATVIARARGRLAGSPFADAPIVPTSVVTGRGFEELKAALGAALRDVPAPRDVGKPRMPIDRVFTLHGIGTVVTGTLSGGSLRRNQCVVLQPTGKVARIRAIQSHNREVDQAGPGTRTALNLPDAALLSAASDGVARGQAVTVAELGGATATLDALLAKSARLLDLKTGAARPLKDGSLVRLHHGTANAAARVRLGNGEPLLPGQRAFAQLCLEEPLFLLGGDRFILRDWPEQLTLAGGVVLDPDANRKRFTDAARQKLLRARAEALEDARVWVLTQLERDRAAPRTGLLHRSRFSAEEIAAAVNVLLAEEVIGTAGEWLILARWWNEVQAAAAAAVRAEHRLHPERAGLALTVLRGAVEADLPAPELFSAVVAELCDGDFVQAGNIIRERSHRLALPSQLQEAGARLRAMLASRPFEPPARRELTPDSASQQALRFLLENGEASEISAELVMLTESFARARETVVNALRERRQATASELRQLLNTSRRVIIPLLEKLDKESVTQRRGDIRVLKES